MTHEQEIMEKTYKAKDSDVYGDYELGASVTMDRQEELEDELQFDGYFKVNGDGYFESFNFVAYLVKNHEDGELDIDVQMWDRDNDHDLSDHDEKKFQEMFNKMIKSF